ncbi:MAG: NADH-quinone oxidoreductase subunit M [Phycisphaerales bacterium]|nr:NADH-quinone oxidoreductase subunit M [Phycisphaerales bacterium]
MSWLSDHILSLVIFLPVVGAAILFVFASWDAVLVRRWALGVSLLTLLLAVMASVLFVQERAQNTSKSDYCLVEKMNWVGGDDDTGARAVKVQYKLGVDGISLPLVVLTAFLTPLAIWGSFTGIQTRHREYYALMLLLLGAMLGVFCARDLLLFYIFFEFTLIPLYFLIGIWGGSQRQKAANMFFIYTLTGSLLTFAGVIYLGWKASICGATGHVFTFDLDELYGLASAGALSSTEQWWLFVAFFAGFAIKVPLFPFHTWLPLAHVEAPTAGSVILAAILLKLGTYGFLRLSLPMLPGATIELAPAIGMLAVIGIIYGAVAAWVQSDVKKLVAYSSVSHLGFCLLGMFCLKMAGLTGSLLYMINHGLSTGALFLIVGMIYERYHTREMSEIGGLARKMPIMAFFLIVFTMSSIGLPGLNGFVSEFLVLLGTFISATEINSKPGPLGIWYAVPAASGILLGAIYMLHMVRRVLFGPVKEPAHGFDGSAGLTQDLTKREIGILAPIALCCLFLGVYPKPVMQVMEPDLARGLNHVVWETVAEADDPETTGGLDSRRAAITDRPGERLSRPPVYDLKEPIRPTGQPSRLPSHLASANGGDE